MCCRYVIPDEAAVAQLCPGKLRWEFHWGAPLFNVAPTTQIPIILCGHEEEWELQGARWGLIPSWWRKTEPPSLTYNARTEEISQKPVWRESYLHFRALMPAQGWYEWVQRTDLPRLRGRQVRQPYFLYCPSANPIAFAALFARWAPPGQPPRLSCALLTKPAAPAIADIHPRMPVVLPPALFSTWLNPNTPEKQLEEALANARTDLQAYPVSTLVNDPNHNSPDLLKRIPLPHTPPLDFPPDPSSANSKVD